MLTTFAALVGFFATLSLADRLAARVNTAPAEYSWESAARPTIPLSSSVRFPIPPAPPIPPATKPPPNTGGRARSAVPGCYVLIGPRA